MGYIHEMWRMNVIRNKPSMFCRIYLHATFVAISQNLENEWKTDEKVTVCS